MSGVIVHSSTWYRQQDRNAVMGWKFPHPAKRTRKKKTRDPNRRPPEPRPASERRAKQREEAEKRTASSMPASNRTEPPVIVATQDDLGTFRDYKRVVLVGRSVSAVQTAELRLGNVVESATNRYLVAFNVREGDVTDCLRDLHAFAIRRQADLALIVADETACQLVRRSMLSDRTLLYFAFRDGDTVRLAVPQSAEPSRAKTIEQEAPPAATQPGPELWIVHVRDLGMFRDFDDLMLIYGSPGAKSAAKKAGLRPVESCESPLIWPGYTPPDDALLQLARKFREMLRERSAGICVIGCTSEAILGHVKAGTSYPGIDTYINAQPNQPLRLVV